MQQPANHHLAQLNIGRIRYEIEDPRMADFSDQSGNGNALPSARPALCGGTSTKAAIRRARGPIRTRASRSICRFGKASRRSSGSFIRRSTSVSTPTRRMVRALRGSIFRDVVGARRASPGCRGGRSPASSISSGTGRAITPSTGKQQRCNSGRSSALRAERGRQHDGKRPTSRSIQHRADPLSARRSTHA